MKTQYISYYVIIVFIQSPSTWVHARTIIKEDGLGLTGLFRGLGATLWRHGLWNTVYFGFYHNLKPIVLHSEVKVICICVVYILLLHLYYFLQNPSVASRLFLGFLAGSLASIANIPFDVAKSRIQVTIPNLYYCNQLNIISLMIFNRGLVQACSH